MNERIARQSVFTLNGRKRESTRFTDGQASERNFDEEGQLVRESHEITEVGLQLKAVWCFGYCEETYRVEHHAADRDAYEAARLPWQDMPPARPPQPPVYPRLTDRVMRGSLRLDTWQMAADCVRVEEIAADGQRLRAFETDRRPDGITVIRQLDADLRPCSEIFHSPDNKLTLEYRYEQGRLTAVSCFVPGRLITARQYENERLRYPGMPLVVDGLTDTLALLQPLLKEERRALKQRNRSVIPDPAIAAQRDASCQALLDDGGQVEAFGWMKSGLNTLGERDRAASRRFMTRLAQCGAVEVYVCEREEVDAGAWNAASLVLRLPQDENARRKIFAMAEKIAWEQGFEDGTDHGQSMLLLRV